MFYNVPGGVLKLACLAGLVRELNCFPVKDPYNTGRLVSFLSLTALSCVHSLQRWVREW